MEKIAIKIIKDIICFISNMKFQHLMVKVILATTIITVVIIQMVLVLVMKVFIQVVEHMDVKKTQLMIIGIVALDIHTT